MADTNDRHQGSDHDLFDETAPRSIFAATWFRAVLVLIVLGVIGAVAVPYILDAMNAPKPSATAKLPTPVPASKPAMAPPVAVTPLPPPGAPPGMAATPAPPIATTPAPAMPPTPATAPSTPAPPITAEQPTDTKLSETKPLGDGRLSDSSSGADALKSADGKSSATTEPTGTKEAMAAPTTSKTGAPAKAAVKTVKSTGKQWYVQVGAFKNAATANKVAAKLREDNYKVDDAPRAASVATVGKTTVAAPSGNGDQYDVIITGQSPAELNTRLAAKGLTVEAAGNGAVVKPSLPLRDAVALSKELAVDGLKVQVRRTGGSTATAERASSGDTLHRVSVGGFPDKATAVATLKELEGKGYKPFLTRR